MDFEPGLEETHGVTPSERLRMSYRESVEIADHHLEMNGLETGESLQVDVDNTDSLGEDSMAVLREVADMVGEEDWKLLGCLLDENRAGFDGPAYRAGQSFSDPGTGVEGEVLYESVAPGMVKADVYMWGGKDGQESIVGEKAYGALKPAVTQVSLSYLSG